MVERPPMADPMSYFSFQPVFHDKRRDMSSSDSGCASSSNISGGSSSDNTSSRSRSSSSNRSSSSGSNNKFYLRLYGVRHMVKDHSDSEKGNPLSPHRLLLSINSKGSFICTIPQTG